ncbi:hypothetical protein PMAYCL1PPCAC_29300 [Pristionchus mayeri]|uniref:Protein farnesyltransferase subunit beta n=1 Tax=Pristionchus mayeri TaxID=1317129 RepID=A0AAN5DAL0_9BILA|nr:hypothetical protein PMAYCL1PPCAC_29300 [Pristionchus mayeri]
MSTDRISAFFRSFDRRFEVQEDGLPTKTTDEQIKVECEVSSIVAQFISTRAELEKSPHFNREMHIAFIMSSLKQLPTSYQGLDASRPWLCYWGVHSLNILGYQISAEMKSEIVTFLKTCVHPDGGYGGGPGQLGHLATTYAAVLCLISLGTQEAFDSIDRDAMYKFLVARHQSSGAYTMHLGGEEDIRAPYLALVTASLLRIMDCKLTDLVAEWIMSCQTFEGGFGGEPGAEAHGGYTFCGFACLCLLDRAKVVDLQALLRWLVRKQMRFEGGFQGRTNKHVDGCYSFWQGAVFRLIDAELMREGLVPLEGAFDARALQEYILVCCQDPHGGLRDKPGVKRDLYHTCYVLSGISIAQSFIDDKTLVLGGEDSIVEDTHPIYNVILSCEEKARNYFSNLSSVNA